jgi:uncharacterized repeat protein (TIGR01451 family)
MRLTSGCLTILAPIIMMTGCSSPSFLSFKQVLQSNPGLALQSEPTRPATEQLVSTPAPKLATSTSSAASPIALATYVDAAVPESEACAAETMHVGDGACEQNETNVCAANGCGGCQSCRVQPFGYEPVSPYYFNPYLIDPNEFICDGGDNAPKARARAGDQIIGVDLEDTVVRYTTDAGDVHVQPSNKVCLYAPRFAAVRKVTGAESGDLAVGAVGVERPEGPIHSQLNQPGLAVTGRDDLGRGSSVRGPDAMRARDRGVPVEVVLQPEVAEDVLAILANLAFINRGILRDTDKPWIAKAAHAAVTWSIDEQVAVTVNSVAPVTLTRDLHAEEMVVYDFPDAGRLRICKMADKSDALPGEMVTFIIRVDNVGDSAVRDIVITDSLVTRLEYVPASETSSVDADFTTQQNDGQSLRLTWKLNKELKVGEGATIEFKCKVR